MVRLGNSVAPKIYMGEALGVKLVKLLCGIMTIVKAAPFIPMPSHKPSIHSVIYTLLVIYECSQ